jgi:hypothetical protein
MGLVVFSVFAMLRVGITCYYIPARVQCTIHGIIAVTLGPSFRWGGVIVEVCWLVCWLASLFVAFRWRSVSRWRVFLGRPRRFEWLQRCVVGVVLATLLFVTTSLLFDIARASMGQHVWCGLLGPGGTWQNLTRS